MATEPELWKILKGILHEDEEVIITRAQRRTHSSTGISGYRRAEDESTMVNT